MVAVIRRHLPNTLTVLRVVLAAAFFATLNAYRFPDIQVWWANVAILLFILAAITDALDGHLARRWQVESLFGRLMDPFCDKILIIGAFIYLAGPRFVMVESTIDGTTEVTMATSVYPWMVVVILARELLVTGIRGVVESQGISFGSQWSGKAKMILQSITVPLVLVLVVNFNPAENAWAYRTCQGLVYLTVIVTVWSGLPYIVGLRSVAVRSPKATAS